MSKAWDINVYEAPPKPPAQRWDHDHHERETETRTGVLTGIERTVLLRAWNHDGQVVYMDRSNASREAEARMTGTGRARRNFTGAKWSVSRGAA